MKFLEEELSVDEARELKHHVAKLLESEGWKFCEALILQRIQIRTQELVGCRIKTQEQLAEFNFIQGGLEELKILPAILKQTYSDLDTFIRKAEDDANDDWDTIMEEQR